MTFIKTAWVVSGILLMMLGARGEAEAESLLMGTSDGPPYMIQTFESGLDIDITRAVLKRIGYNLQLDFYPLSRALRELKFNRIDLTAPFFTDAPKGIFVSEPYIEYRPSVISRANVPQLNSVAELASYRIATFQGATGYFGGEFEAMSMASPNYIEHHDMGKLISLLLQDRTDIVILDFWIFHHFLAQSEENGREQAFVFHPLIPRVPAVVAFHDVALRDKFNQGLAAIKLDGTYDDIIHRYKRPDSMHKENP